MKKKIIEQVHGSVSPTQGTRPRTGEKMSKSVRVLKDLFQLNYRILAKTVNETLQKPNFETVINMILLRQPSIEMITFREIQKNLVFQEYLEHYHRLQHFQDKIRLLIPKHLPYVKANYMDFKIKNYLILNKYKLNDKPHLPYPLCTKFQKLTDSKMSSTKSVENKVLHELQNQLKSQSKYKKNPQLKSKNKTKNKTKPLDTERFQIKALTKAIAQMIQNIKDVRALQNFKKQMEKTSQFKFGLSNFQDKQTKFVKKPEVKEILKLSANNELKEKQFKRKVQNDMGKHFPEERKTLNLLGKRLSKEIVPDILMSNQIKNKFHFKSAQRLLTNADHQIEEYGLSVIRQKRKKSKSKERKTKSKSKSKSRDHSKKSKHSTSQQYPLNLNIRLQTEYSEASTQRINTNYSNLTKSKSSSRIPTEYDSTVIINRSKSKGKNKEVEGFMFAATLGKKDSKSSSTSEQNGFGFKKSKSKSKVNLLQFNSPNKIPKK